MYRPGRILAWSAGLTALLVAVVIVSAALGPVRIDPVTVSLAALNMLQVPTGLEWRVTTAFPISGSLRYPGLRYAPVFAFDVPETSQTIVGDVRLPRIALAATVGFGLAAAGTVMQGFFRNPLADPSIIGVSTGAAAGAVAAIAFPALVPFGGLHLSAFVGALLTAFPCTRLRRRGDEPLSRHCSSPVLPSRPSSGR